MTRRLLNTAILNVDDHAKIKATKEIEVNGKQLAKVEQIPTNISDLDNDSGFITAEDIPEAGGVTATYEGFEEMMYIYRNQLPCFIRYWCEDPGGGEGAAIYDAYRNHIMDIPYEGVSEFVVFPSGNNGFTIHEGGANSSVDQRSGRIDSNGLVMEIGAEGAVSYIMIIPLTLL